MDSSNKNSGIFLGMIIGIVGMIVFFAILSSFGCVKFEVNRDNDIDHFTSNIIEKISNDSTNRILEKKEALELGEELYNKVTEIYETWLVRPYCGYSNLSINSLNKEHLGDSSLGNGEYYVSDFKSLNELKDYLRQWLSNQIISDKVKESYQFNGETYYKYVEDLSLLSNHDLHYGYVDYVVKDGTLYCRADVGKGYLTRYLNHYNLSISDISSKKIIYSVKSAYLSDDIELGATTELEFGKYRVNQINYKETQFIIEKINDKWIVTNYELHE